VFEVGVGTAELPLLAGEGPDEIEFGLVAGVVVGDVDVEKGLELGGLAVGRLKRVGENTRGESL
jgi:hypothetical protein